MNIFENIMASNEFVDSVSDKIAGDWNDLGQEPDTVERLYNWIRNGFSESLTKAVMRKVGV